jgi:hypothetical protein
MAESSTNSFHVLPWLEKSRLHLKRTPAELAAPAAIPAVQARARSIKWTDRFLRVLPGFVFPITRDDGDLGDHGGSSQIV